jgi:hypothetical protein
MFMDHCGAGQPVRFDATRARVRPLGTYRRKRAMNEEVHFEIPRHTRRHSAQQRGGMSLWN